MKRRTLMDRTPQKAALPGAGKRDSTGKKPQRIRLGGNRLIEPIESEGAGS